MKKIQVTVELSIVEEDIEKYNLNVEDIKEALTIYSDSQVDGFVLSRTEVMAKDGESGEMEGFDNESAIFFDDAKILSAKVVE